MPAVEAIPKICCRPPAKSAHGRVGGSDSQRPSSSVAASVYCAGDRPAECWFRCDLVAIILTHPVVTPYCSEKWRGEKNSFVKERWKIGQNTTSPCVCVCLRECSWYGVHVLALRNATQNIKCNPRPVCVRVCVCASQASLLCASDKRRKEPQRCSVCALVCVCVLQSVLCPRITVNVHVQFPSKTASPCRVAGFCTKGPFQY